MALPNLSGLALHAAAPTGPNYDDEGNMLLNDDDRFDWEDGTPSDDEAGSPKRRKWEEEQDLRRFPWEDKIENYQRRSASPSPASPAPPPPSAAARAEAAQRAARRRREIEAERQAMAAAAQREERRRRMEAERQARYKVLIAQARAAAAAPISEEEEAQQHEAYKRLEARRLGLTLEQYEVYLARRQRETEEMRNNAQAAREAAEAQRVAQRQA